jgi:hypothetical protein
VAVVPLDAVPRRRISTKHFANGSGAWAALGRLRLDHHSVSDLEGHFSPPFDSLRTERTTSVARRQALRGIDAKGQALLLCENHRFGPGCVAGEFLCGVGSADAVARVQRIDLAWVGPEYCFGRGGVEFLIAVCAEAPFKCDEDVGVEPVRDVASHDRECFL